MSVISVIELRPSASGRWVHCPGAPLMEAGCPEEDSTVADEGTLAHNVAEVMLAGTGPTPDVASEMIEYVRLYTSDIVRVVMGMQTDLHVEQLVQIPRIHPTLQGTPDAWCLDPATRTIYLWDLKYGYGIVDVYRCWQLICYAIGIIDSIPGNLEQELTVVMRIVQPRPFHEDGKIREWRVAATDLRPYSNQLSDAAVAVYSPSPDTRSGPWCKQCTARQVCKSAILASMNAIDVMGKTEMSILDPVALGHTLTDLARAKEMISCIYDALETQAMSIMKRGAGVPGWVLKTGIGRKVWTKPDEEVYRIGDLLGVELRKTTSITPTQAIAAGIPEASLNTCTKRNAGSIKLKKDDNSRAEEIFRK